MTALEIQKLKPSHIAQILPAIPVERRVEYWGSLEDKETVRVLSNCTPSYALVENGKVYACGGFIPVKDMGVMEAWASISPDIGFKRLRWFIWHAYALLDKMPADIRRIVFVVACDNEPACRIARLLCFVNETPNGKKNFFADGSPAYEFIKIPHRKSLLN